MKSFNKAKVIQPLIDVARRYSKKPEFAAMAAAYVVLLSIRHGESFPLPALENVLGKEELLPEYVRVFLETYLADHWKEYQQTVGSYDEDSLVDFFSNEATLMLMESRHDFSPHPAVDQLCTGLLEIKSGNAIADLNCGIGKFVRKAWFALWNVTGSDEGLSVVGYSRDVEFAALTYILCNVTGVGAKVVAQSIFISHPERYDRIALIPPFGMETRAINIPMTQQVLAERFENFPELRLSSADWVFAARAASLLSTGGRAVVAVPIHALNGSQSQTYREFLVRNQLIEAVIAIPRGFLNGMTVGFAIVVMREGCREIKFINGEEYQTIVEDVRLLDVPRLLKDYRALNDYEAVTTKPLEAVYSRECNLAPDFYLGEDLVYNNSKPFGKIVREIRRGAKLPVEAWKEVAGDDTSPVKKVAFKHFSEGLIDECLPGLTAVPPGAEDAVLEVGDLLISRMGFPFKVAVVEYRNEKLVADENVWIVRMGGNRMLAYYLRAYLESERGAKWLSRLSTGATLRTISAKNIEKIPVPNTDEETRDAIARELEKTTILVRKNRQRLNGALAAMKNVFDTFNKDGGL
ncbi:MAG: N-6 DNA methylase [Kiritimatiellae bacterium]|nr:N-6 DNA methylase [Kiritimatiellia bacterium]